MEEIALLPLFKLESLDNLGRFGMHSSSEKINMVSQTKSQSALDDNTKNFTKTFTKQICILQNFSENVSLFLLD